MTGLIVNSDAVVFDAHKVFVWPKTQNKEIVLDYSGLNLNFSNVFLDEIREVPKVIRNNADSLFFGAYIFSKSPIRSYTFKGSTLTSVIMVNFLKENNTLNHVSFTEKQLADLVNIIKTNNTKFLNNLIHNSSKRSATEAVILVNNIPTYSNWVGYTNSDNIILVPLNEEKNYVELAHTISHEYLHKLFSLGKAVSVDFGPKTRWNHFWFDEGFNDYYASLLNYRIGIISKAEYIELLNKKLKSYYQYFMAPQELMSEECASQISSVLLESEDFFPAFYRIGMVMALDLDNIIYIRSNGKYNLDDLLKNAIHTSCKQFPCKISQEVFINELTKIANSNNTNGYASYIKSHIIDFVPVRLPDLLHEPRAKLFYNKEQEGINYGFFAKKLFCTGIISDVDEKSNAYKAGLRNGMKVKNYSENNILSKEWKILISVENLSSESLIEYSPLEKVLVPYYNVLN